MIHIVFQPADAEKIEEAILLDETLKGDVLIIKDDFSLGPLAGQAGDESFQDRRQWWEDVLQFSPYTDQTAMVDDRLTVHQLKRMIDEQQDETVWIWMAQNAHDVCGYYWLISRLMNYQGRIFVLYLNNLPFINEKGGLFYPDYLFEIRPSEFLKAKKLARPVTISEFELDSDEYKKLCAENDIIRLLEGGKKIVGKQAGFFDNDILKLAAEHQKLNKIFSSFFQKSKQYISDVFIAWRIRKMAEEGKVTITGDWEKGWKEITVKSLENVAEVKAENS